MNDTSKATFNLYEYFLENQNDPIIQNTSIALKLIYPSHNKIYYFPHIVMKFVNPLFYEHKSIDLVMDMDETEDLFLDVCCDILNQNDIILAISKKNMLKFAISEKLSPSFYKILTPKFNHKNDYNNFVNSLSIIPNHSELFLKRYYLSEDSSFLYELMEQHNIIIPSDVLKDMTFNVNRYYRYNLDILAKFGNLCGEYDMRDVHGAMFYSTDMRGYLETKPYYAYTSIEKRMDGNIEKYYLKDPYYSRNPGKNFTEWLNVKKNAKEILYVPYTKTVSFSFVFDGHSRWNTYFHNIYEYIMDKQQDNIFISESTKVIISQENRNDQRILYLPNSILKDIDENYFESMKNAINSNMFNNTDFEIYLSDGETIEGFLSFLRNFLNNYKKNDGYLFFELKSKEDIQEYLVAYRFSKHTLYKMYFNTLNIKPIAFLELLIDSIPVNSPIFETIISKLLERKYISPSDLNKFGIIYEQ